MPRFFNTAGPCKSDIHFVLPPMRRLPEADPLIEGLPQLEGYLGRLGLTEGFLVIFDRRRSTEEVPWDERPRWEKAELAGGKRVRVLRL